MPYVEDLFEQPMREQTIFFILDTSGSMNLEDSIMHLNRAIRETTLFLREKAEEIEDYIIKIALIEYNSGCRWLTPRPVPVQDYSYEDLVADGASNIYSALYELNSKMSRAAFFDSPGGRMVPILIFINGGVATEDYKKALEQLKQNNWFKIAYRIAFAIGEFADIEMLSEIVGFKENVFRVEKGEAFTELLIDKILLIDKMRTLKYHCDFDLDESLKYYLDNNIVVDIATEYDKEIWDDVEW